MTKFAVLLIGLSLLLAAPAGRLAADDQYEQTPAEQEQQQQQQQQPAEHSQQHQAQAVTAGQIADRPDDFYGKKVEVTAEVERVINPNVFTLDEDKIGAGPDVLVVLPKDSSGKENVKDNSFVKVTGEVKKMTVAEIQQEYPELGDLEQETEIENRPVIVAETAQPAEDMPERQDREMNPDENPEQ